MDELSGTYPSSTEKKKPSIRFPMATSYGWLTQRNGYGSNLMFGHWLHNFENVKSKVQAGEHFRVRLLAYLSAYLWSKFDIDVLPSYLSVHLPAACPSPHSLLFDSWW